MKRGRDRTARTAVICAYAPELPMLEAKVVRPRRTTVHGLTFITGRMAGHPVVLLHSGMSMVNAAMATQMVLERFTVERIVVCGIAGGADPALGVGDIAIPARWAQYLEATFARETAEGWGPDILADHEGVANYGMIFPHAVMDARSRSGTGRQMWFEADPDLLEAARRLTLPESLALHVGGSGVSGPVFVDNAAFCDYLNRAFGAQAVDMESAAIAQVALANHVPFIAIRGLSDRAGAEEGVNTAILNVDAVAADTAKVVAALLKALPPGGITSPS
jgi:adenosylhomocysteine nucleosidase